MVGVFRKKLHVGVSWLRISLPPANSLESWTEDPVVGGVQSYSSWCYSQTQRRHPDNFAGGAQCLTKEVTLLQTLTFLQKRLTLASTPLLTGIKADTLSFLTCVNTVGLHCLDGACSGFIHMVVVAALAAERFSLFGSLPPVCANFPHVINGTRKLSTIVLSA